MFNLMKKGARWRAVVLGCACLLAVLALSGCQSVRFYTQAVAGQYEILARQRPIEDLIRDPATDPKLKAQLELVKRIRTFAEQDLKLPTGGSYVKYADLQREYVVWNVNVAPPLSLQPKTWWFPIVGNASYRGYFSEADARHYAAIWDKKGWDTYIGDVPTYSTLGWFPDPLLSTFIFEPEPDLADTIFHELTHKRLFVAGDTDFNEALAVMVADEGVRRWYHASANSRAYELYSQGARQENDFLKLVMATRSELETVYGDAGMSAEVKLRRKAEIIAQTRVNYTKLKAAWGVEQAGYDHWFSGSLNNAQLSTVAAYYDLVPSFQAILRAQGGDLEKFFHEVEGLAKRPLEQRHDALRAYLTTK
jgi:predicted aminopeptidase